jgi:hypothetical protein
MTSNQSRQKSNHRPTNEEEYNQGYNQSGHTDDCTAHKKDVRCPIHPTKFRRS